MCEKNACGPFWFPKWLRSLLSKKFNPACVQHDLAYVKKGKSRILIDALFLVDMLKLCKNPFDMILAMWFFMLVLAGGWISWKNC